MLHHSDKGTGMVLCSFFYQHILSSYQFYTFPTHLDTSMKCVDGARILSSFLSASTPFYRLPSFLSGMQVHIKLELKERQDYH